LNTIKGSLRKRGRLTFFCGGQDFLRGREIGESAGTEERVKREVDREKGAGIFEGETWEGELRFIDRKRQVRKSIASGEEFLK